MKKKKRVNDNLKTVVRTMTVLFFITIMGFYLFNLYINIDISEPNNTPTYTVTRTARDYRRNKTRK